MEKEKEQTPELRTEAKEREKPELTVKLTVRHYKKIMSMIDDYKERNRKLTRLIVFMSVLTIGISVVSFWQSAKIYRLEDTNRTLYERVIQLQDMQENEGQGE